MRERNQILELWRKLAEEGESAVLATVVRTEGSSYRVPGARMLLSQSGERVGSISGGCLEADIVRKAWWLTAQGPVLRKYDTTPEGEISTGGYGLGCNGVVYVLLERVIPDAPSVLPVLNAVRQERRPVNVMHVLSPAELVGQRLITDADGVVTHNIRNPELLARLLTQMPGPEVFIETLAPPTRLLIFGAGDDATPLAELGNYLGWQVAVLDGRAHYARAEKFPFAEVIVRSAGSAAPAIDEWTVAVVMTHSYSQDLDGLRSLIAQPLRYLGVLGPRKRTEQLLADLSISAEDAPEKLHMPMGLDLGGDGPEQVALAVVAEIQSVLSGRTGAALRGRKAPIHRDEASSEAEAWVKSIVCA